MCDGVYLLVVGKPGESAVEKAVRFEKRVQPDNAAR